VSIGKQSIGSFDFAVYGGKGKDIIDLSGEDESANVAVVAGGGSDTLTGGAGDDTIVFAKLGDLDKGDIVKGGAGSADTAVLATGDYTADLFKGFSSIEVIRIFDDGTDDHRSVALDNAFFANATVVEGGYKAVSIDFGSDSDGREVVSAGSVTLGNVEIDVTFGIGAATFTGGAERDLVQFSDDGAGSFRFDIDDTLSGGLGWDTISLFAGGTTTIDDSAWEHVTGFENLQLFGNDTGITLESAADAANLQQIDASHLSGDLTLDTLNMVNGITVLAGSGKDSIDLGDGDDTVVYGSGDLTVLDHVNGGSGADLNIIKFTGDVSVDDDAFTDVSNFQVLMAEGGTLAITLEDQAATVGITTIIAEDADGLDLEAVAGKFVGDLAVTGSAHDDSIVTGDGNDQILGGGGADDLTGGIGQDTFIYSSTGDSVLLTGGKLDKADTIHDFTVADDSIDLAQLGLNGAIEGPAQTINALSDIGGTIATAGFFGGTDGDVVVADIGADTYVFADTNKDGNFNFDSDLVIKVAGVPSTDVLANIVN